MFFAAAMSPVVLLHIFSYLFIRTTVGWDHWELNPNTDANNITWQMNDISLQVNDPFFWGGKANGYDDYVDPSHIKGDVT